MSGACGWGGELLPSGTDTALLDDPEIQELVLPALRADYKAVETYVEQPGPPLQCPITAIIGDADPQVTDEEVRDWARHTTGPFELTRFPGGHFYLRDQADAVAGVIAASLARA